MASNQIIMIIAIVVYLLCMLYVGWIYSRRNKSTDDFYLGGRKLGALTTAMSAEASDMSSWLLMGVPGLAYISGVADAGWTCIGLALGTYLNWLVVSKRLRNYSADLGAITLPDFISRRFHDEKHTLSLISALIIVIFFVPYTASGFSACGKLFNTLFGVDYTTAMLISALVIVLYTTLGGFMAASMTDLIQSIIMTISLIAVFIFGIGKAGGLNAVMENAKALPGYLSFDQIFDNVSGTAQSYGFLNKISMLAWGLGYFGMPHILLRFMGSKNTKQLTLSRRVATIWVVISMAAAILIGIVGNAMSKVGALETFASTTTSETLIVHLANLISENGWLAAVLGGLILAGILAATMSTADSQLLAAASSVSKDLVEDCFHAKLNAKKSMLVARLAVVAISVVAAVIALDQNSSVFNVVSFAWAGFGAAFGPVVLLSLFWKRTNKTGALCGMVAGGAMVFLWKYLVRPMGGMWDLYELLPAFIVACVANIIGSLASKAPDAAVIAEFDAASAKKDD